MKTLYAAYHGLSLVCVGTDRSQLEIGIAAWRITRRRFGQSEPQLRIVQQEIRIHPRWLDRHYFATVRDRIDTR